MGIANILYAALFCFVMVFALLGCLYILVVLSNRAIRSIENRIQKQ